MLRSTLYPNRITVRYIDTAKRYNNLYDSYIGISKKYNERSLDNLKKKKDTFTFSKQSSKKLIDSICFLYQVSKERKVFLGNDKYIYNYKASFVTLTLPSTQVHTDLEIKSCLKKFLDNLRIQFNLKNYVWKAELQKNKNIHFHLVFDQHINYNVLRYYWNLAIKPLGYIDSYENKFKKMSLLQYAIHRGKKVEEVKEAYIKGVKTKWRTPNSVDVKSVNSSKMLAVYLAKYLVKDIIPVKNKDSAVSNNQDNEIDTIRALKFGKMWSRSNSLSKIKFISNYDTNSLLKYLESYKSFKEVSYTRFYEYCKVIYFNFKVISCGIKKWFTQKMVELGITYNYPFPAPI